MPDVTAPFKGIEKMSIGSTILVLASQFQVHWQTVSMGTGKEYADSVVSLTREDDARIKLSTWGTNQQSGLRKKGGESKGVLYLGETVKSVRENKTTLQRRWRRRNSVSRALF
jgi:hypothetical protein